MKMKHLHMALEIAGAAAVLYVLYMIFKPADGAAPQKPVGELASRGSFQKRRTPVKVEAVKEGDSFVENDGEEEGSED